MSWSDIGAMVAVACTVTSAAYFVIKLLILNEASAMFQKKEDAPSKNCQAEFLSKDDHLQREKLSDFRYQKIEESLEENKKLLYAIFRRDVTQP